jgi:hypothetical protein
MRDTRFENRPSYLTSAAVFSAAVAPAAWRCCAAMRRASSRVSSLLDELDEILMLATSVVLIAALLYVI